uniref:RRM domain-containing protein n=1 Tax=Salvator merianae TaxID=96440 RepID=A0A8D0KN14_SALMN
NKTRRNRQDWEKNKKELENYDIVKCSKKWALIKNEYKSWDIQAMKRISKIIRKKKEKRMINKLQNLEGEIKVKNKEIVEILAKYYKNLYKGDRIQDFVWTIDRKLTEEYAFLSFITAHDAELAIKEMNEKEICGKAVKLQFVKNIEEKGIKSPPNCPENHSRTFSSASENTEYKKSCNRLWEGSVSPLAPLKMSASAIPPYLSSDSVKSSLSVLSACLVTPKPSTTFIPPNRLNLRSFRKVVKKLEDLHPNVNRNSILDALLEVKENRGSLTGLPLSTIVQMTSLLLNKKFPAKSEENSVYT